VAAAEAAICSVGMPADKTIGYRQKRMKNRKEAS
jgi:hypothetical protein